MASNNKNAGGQASAFDYLIKLGVELEDTAAIKQKLQAQLKDAVKSIAIEEITLGDRAKGGESKVISALREEINEKVNRGRWGGITINKVRIAADAFKNVEASINISKLKITGQIDANASIWNGVIAKLQQALDKKTFNIKIDVDANKVRSNIEAAVGSLPYYINIEGKGTAAVPLQGVPTQGAGSSAKQSKPAGRSSGKKTDKTPKPKEIDLDKQESALMALEDRLVSEGFTGVYSHSREDLGEGIALTEKKRFSRFGTGDDANYIQTGHAQEITAPGQKYVFENEEMAKAARQRRAVLSEQERRSRVEALRQVQRQLGVDARAPIRRDATFRAIDADIRRGWMVGVTTDPKVLAQQYQELIAKVEKFNQLQDEAARKIQRRYQGPLQEGAQATPPYNTEMRPTERRRNWRDSRTGQSVAIEDKLRQDFGGETVVGGTKLRVTDPKTGQSVVLEDFAAKRRAANLSEDQQKQIQSVRDRMGFYSDKQIRTTPVARALSREIDTQFKQGLIDLTEMESKYRNLVKLSQQWLQSQKGITNEMGAQEKAQRAVLHKMDLAAEGRKLGAYGHDTRGFLGWKALWRNMRYGLGTPDPHIERAYLKDQIGMVRPYAEMLDENGKNMHGWAVQMLQSLQKDYGVQRKRSGENLESKRGHGVMGAIGNPMRIGMGVLIGDLTFALLQAIGDGIKATIHMEKVKKLSTIYANAALEDMITDAEAAATRGGRKLSQAEKDQIRATAQQRLTGGGPFDKGKFYGDTMRMALQFGIDVNEVSQSQSFWLKQLRNVKQANWVAEQMMRVKQLTGTDIEKLDNMVLAMGLQRGSARGAGTFSLEAGLQGVYMASLLAARKGSNLHDTDVQKGLVMNPENESFQIMQFMDKGGMGVLKQLGYGTEYAAALPAIMRQVINLSGDQIGVSLSAILQRLREPEMVKKLQSMGVRSTNDATFFRELEKAYNDVDESGRRRLRVNELGVRPPDAKLLVNILEHLGSIEKSAGWLRGVGGKDGRGFAAATQRMQEEYAKDNPEIQAQRVSIAWKALSQSMIMGITGTEDFSKALYELSDILVKLGPVAYIIGSNLKVILGFFSALIGSAQRFATWASMIWDVITAGLGGLVTFLLKIGKVAERLVAMDFKGAWQAGSEAINPETKLWSTRSEALDRGASTAYKTGMDLMASGFEAMSKPNPIYQQGYGSQKPPASILTQAQIAAQPPLEPPSDKEKTKRLIETYLSSSNKLFDAVMNNIREKMTGIADRLRAFEAVTQRTQLAINRVAEEERRLTEVYKDRLPTLAYLRELHKVQQDQIRLQGQLAAQILKHAAASDQAAREYGALQKQVPSAKIAMSRPGALPAADGESDTYQARYNEMREDVLRKITTGDPRGMLRNYDPRFFHPKYHTRAEGGGYDIRMRAGTPIWAEGVGRVTEAGYVTRKNGSPSYGNTVVVDYGMGFSRRFAHLSKINVKPGQELLGDEQLGLSGGIPGAPGAGRSTGPHLHVELRYKGRALSGDDTVQIDPRNNVYIFWAGAKKAEYVGNLGYMEGTTGRALLQKARADRGKRVTELKSQLGKQQLQASLEATQQRLEAEKIMTDQILRSNQLRTGAFERFLEIYKIQGEAVQRQRQYSVYGREATARRGEYVAETEYDLSFGATPGLLAQRRLQILEEQLRQRQGLTRADVNIGQVRPAHDRLMRAAELMESPETENFRAALARAEMEIHRRAGAENWGLSDPSREAREIGMLRTQRWRAKFKQLDPALKTWLDTGGGNDQLRRAIYNALWAGDGGIRRLEQEWAGRRSFWEGERRQHVDSLQDLRKSLSENLTQANMLPQTNALARLTREWEKFTAQVEINRLVFERTGRTYENSLQYFEDMEEMVARQTDRFAKLGKIGESTFGKVLRRDNNTGDIFTLMERAIGDSEIERQLREANIDPSLLNTLVDQMRAARQGAEQSRGARETYYNRLRLQRQGEDALFDIESNLPTLESAFERRQRQRRERLDLKRRRYLSAREKMLQQQQGGPALAPWEVFDASLSEGWLRAGELDLRHGEVAERYRQEDYLRGVLQRLPSTRPRYEQDTAAYEAELATRLERYQRAQEMIAAGKGDQLSGAEQYYSSAENLSVIRQLQKVLDARKLQQAIREGFVTGGREFFMAVMQGRMFQGAGGLVKGIGQVYQSAIAEKLSRSIIEPLLDSVPGLKKSTQVPTTPTDVFTERHLPQIDQNTREMADALREYLGLDPGAPAIPGGEGGLGISGVPGKPGSKPGSKDAKNKSGKPTALTYLAYAGAGYAAWNAGATGGPVEGAIGGVLSGWSIAGPVGGAVGGVLGLLGGIFGKKKPKAPEAEKTYDPVMTPKDIYYATPGYRPFSAFAGGRGLSGAPINLKVEVDIKSNMGLSDSAAGIIGENIGAAIRFKTDNKLGSLYQTGKNLGDKNLV
jgi:murein DD-endopeptidase MepM/ murein hydrolase activator NlpD